MLLVPGAGGAAWYWHRLVPELQSRGHSAIAVDLPGDDETRGIHEYADLIVAAIDDRDGAIVVAQSMGGFSAPMACDRHPVRLLVFLNAMIPRPGETAGEWWANTGSEEARLAGARAGGYPSAFDLQTYFLHDVPAEAAAGGERNARNEADIAFTQQFNVAKWPPATTLRVLAGRDDRFFPLDFQRKVARDRLGCEVDVIPGGHLVALSRPVELADRLERYAGESIQPPRGPEPDGQPDESPPRR